MLKTPLVGKLTKLTVQNIMPEIIISYLSHIQSHFLV